MNFELYDTIIQEIKETEKKYPPRLIGTLTDLIRNFEFLKSQFRYSVTTPSSITRYIDGEDWLENNQIPFWHEKGSYLFSNEDDALLFKLTFGGS